MKLLEKIEKLMIKLPKLSHKKYQPFQKEEPLLQLEEEGHLLGILLEKGSTKVGKNYLINIYDNGNNTSRYAVQAISGKRGKLNSKSRISHFKVFDTREEAVKSAVSLTNRKIRKKKGSYKQIGLVSQDRQLKEEYNAFLQLEPCQVNQAKIKVEAIEQYIEDRFSFMDS